MDIEKITNLEDKQKLAVEIAKKVRNSEVIGFGSGTTCYLAAIEIGKKVQKENLHITAIPTSNEIQNVCTKYGIKIGSLLENDINWAFDGADEVDPNNNMLKGMGKALFKEKLNLLSSPKNFILADKTKFVTKLGEKHLLPIEVYPQAMKFVASELTEKLGATETVYQGMTENDNAIIHCKFENLNEELEKKIKLIPGVIESGLFMGMNVEIITV